MGKTYRRGFYIHVPGMAGQSRAVIVVGFLFFVSAVSGQFHDSPGEAPPWLVLDPECNQTPPSTDPDLDEYNATSLSRDEALAIVKKLYPDLALAKRRPVSRTAYAIVIGIMSVGGYVAIVQDQPWNQVKNYLTGESSSSDIGVGILFYHILVAIFIALEVTIIVAGKEAVLQATQNILDWIFRRGQQENQRKPADNDRSVDGHSTTDNNGAKVSCVEPPTNLRFSTSQVDAAAAFVTRYLDKYEAPNDHFTVYDTNGKYVWIRCHAKPISDPS